MSPSWKEAPLGPQGCSITTSPSLNPLLNGNPNIFLRMKRFFSLLLNIGHAGGRWQVSEPFSTKMSPRSYPRPGGWWLPVVHLSFMHRLLSKHCSPAVSYSMATSKKTHCAVAHSFGVLSPKPHSIWTPPHHRGLSRGWGPSTDLDVWSQNPAGTFWSWGWGVRGGVGAMLDFSFWAVLHLEKKRSKWRTFAYLHKLC